MTKYENVVQSAAEKLLEDERLRSNLSDDEANVIINWAIDWLQGRAGQAKDEAAARQMVEAEMARVRPTAAKLNDLMAGGKTPPLPAAKQALGLPATSKQAAAKGKPDRKATLLTLTSLLAESWRQK